MATDLNAILSGTATPEPAPSPETEAPAAPERHDDEILDDGWEGESEPDPQGDKPADDADPSAPPAEEEDSAKALKEERRKRQELERRLAELEAKAPQPEQDGPVDPVRQRLDLSVEYAKEQFNDYEEKESAFIESIQAHPRGAEIYQAMLADKHPARFAYELGAKILALREIGDPRTYKERVLAQAQAAAPPPKPQPDRTSLPQTLAASRDSGGRFSPRDSAAPTPLGEILAR
jgi:hypothetical protein